MAVAEKVGARASGRPSASRSTSAVAIFIDPFSRHFENDRLFDLRAGAQGGDDALAPYVYLRERLGAQGIAVHTADLLEAQAVAPAEQNVYISMGLRSRYARLTRRDDVVASAFFVVECPIVEPALYRDLDRVSKVFKRLFSYSTTDALRPFLRAPLTFESFRVPQASERVNETAWARRGRGFLTMINANKIPQLSAGELYTERLRAVEHFARLGEIDLYGVGWDGPAFRVGSSRVPTPARSLAHRTRRAKHRIRPSRDPLQAAARLAYRGAVESKAETLSRYTFAICYENMILEGWVTEKIFDCFYAGTVPVYWGAPDIERWIPKDCFIDMRELNGYAQLRERLLTMSPREIDGYREAAREYLGSERFYPFSKHAFAEQIGALVEQDSSSLALP